MPESLPGQQVARFNFLNFMGHLVGVFFSLLLGPFLAFAISFAVFLLNKTSSTLGTIFWEYLYGDALLSIITICTIVVFSSEHKIQKRIERYWGKASRVYTVIHKLCQLVLFFLVILAYLYKANTGDPIQNCWVYNVLEVSGFCLCIIAQCISHPEAYFCP